MDGDTKDIDPEVPRGGWKAPTDQVYALGVEGLDPMEGVIWPPEDPKQSIWPPYDH